MYITITEGIVFEKKRALLSSDYARSLSQPKWSADDDDDGRKVEKGREGQKEKEWERLDETNK